MRPPTVAEAQEATRIGEHFGPAILRRHAEMIVRCADCNGIVIATVTWISDLGRPLAAVRERGDRLNRTTPLREVGWTFLWADRGTVLHSRCNAHRFAWFVNDVLEVLPGSQQPSRIVRVSHDATSGQGLRSIT